MQMSHVDVVILGAGLTGLTVARALKVETKHSFLVLEARDRVGGRVHSVQEEEGPVLEMGATWFFPPFRNLFKLLRELKVELGEQYLKGYVMHETSREAEPSKVSLSSLYDQSLTLSCPQSFSSEDEEGLFRIKGGTQSLVRRLAETVGLERIRLGSPVSSVEVRERWWSRTAGLCRWRRVAG